MISQFSDFRRRLHRFRRTRYPELAIEWRDLWSRLVSPNRLFETSYASCSCVAHCAHAGGLHSYIDAYRSVLAFARPHKVLEWGPGRNTDLALEVGAAVFSIEQDPQWLRPETPGLSQIVTEVDDPSYVLPTQHFDADVFFVDSRRRDECIRNLAAHATKPNHIVCLHDAQRRRYHPALRRYRYVRFLSPGLAVASHSRWICSLRSAPTDAR